MKRLVTLAVAVSAAIPLIAETETVGDYTWTDCIGRGIVANAV